MKSRTRNRSSRRSPWLALVALAVALGVAAGIHAGEPGLVGYWKLAGDTRDHSGMGRDATNHGADLAAPGPDGKPGGAARFGGRDNYLEVPADKAPRLGTGDFSILVRVHTAADLDDAPG